MMMQEIYDKLTPVQRRQKLVRMVRLLGIGLVAGSLTAVALTVAGSLLALPILRLASWGTIACGPLIALVLAQRSPPTWTDAARAVDTHFRLDDRTQSAVTFLEQGKLSGLYALQVSDTAGRLTDLDTTAAVHVRLPKSLIMGIGWTLVALALLLFLPQQERAIATDNTISPADDSQSTAAKPKAVPASLPDGVSWDSALNDENVIAPGDANIVKTHSDQQITTATQLLDMKIDATYRTNSSRSPQ
jgi:hypothetical protein